jgi:UPF0176 protein
MDYVNISGYQFFALEDLPLLKTQLKALTLKLALKGTILLSSEGINLFLAGGPTQITNFQQALTQQFGFPEFECKKSYSAYQPFSRMLVKIKAEIITMGIKEINPGLKPAPAISSQTLKQWLDEGRDVVLLDTRNDYEMALGKFASAITLDLTHFRSFPKAVQQLDPRLKSKTIVTYCTGGIRCEKAAPYLIEQGFEQVYQLDGGILKYFETVGQAHYQGDCFVFDKRVAVNAQLQETATTQCFACRMPVLPEQQRSPYYVVEKFCPHCYHRNAAQHTPPSSTDKAL